jgi:hypothetical protein
MKKFKLGFSMLGLIVLTVLGIKVLFFTSNVDLLKFIEDDMFFMKFVAGILILDGILFYLTYSIKMLALIEKDKLINELIGNKK